MYVGWGDPADEGYDEGPGASGFDCTEGATGSGASGSFLGGGAGFFKFAANTVNVSCHWIRKHSPTTGNRYAIEGIMILRGKLLECIGGDSLSDQIDVLEDAFSYDCRTLALYNDDGTVTQHVLPAGVDSLVDGPKVVRFSYPRGDRAEYATLGHRSFYIEVRALYDYGETCDANSAIIDYHEVLQYVGLGGPELAKSYTINNVIRTWNGRTLTPTTLIQSGYSRGWGGFVLPLPPVEPASCHWDRCSEEYGSPTAGQCLSKEYTMRWRYEMTLASIYAVWSAGTVFPLAPIPYSPLTKV